MEKNDWLQELSGGNMISDIIKTNSQTDKFNLTLSGEDIELLLAERKEMLRQWQRVEFGEGILKKLIFAFCDSSYIYQENYVDTLIRLQEIFYLYKNESMDELTDDELIDYMRESFEEKCQGSLEHLEDTCLEEFARKIRKKTNKFIGR